MQLNYLILLSCSLKESNNVILHPLS